MQGRVSPAQTMVDNSTSFTIVSSTDAAFKPADLCSAGPIADLAPISFDSAQDPSTASFCGWRHGRTTFRAFFAGVGILLGLLFIVISKRYTHLTLAVTSRSGCGLNSAR
jgi:hypothetical protein